MEAESGGDRTVVAAPAGWTWLLACFVTRFDVLDLVSSQQQFLVRFER